MMNFLCPLVSQFIISKNHSSLHFSLPKNYHKQTFLTPPLLLSLFSPPLPPPLPPPSPPPPLLPFTQVSQKDLTKQHGKPTSLLVVWGLLWERRESRCLMVLFICILMGGVGWCNSIEERRRLNPLRGWIIMILIFRSFSFFFFFFFFRDIKCYYYNQFCKKKKKLTFSLPF